MDYKMTATRFRAISAYIILMLSLYCIEPFYDINEAVAIQTGFGVFFVFTIVVVILYLVVRVWIDLGDGV